jgi:hypothetical protein
VRQALDDFNEAVEAAQTFATSVGERFRSSSMTRAIDGRRATTASQSTSSFAAVVGIQRSREAGADPDLEDLVPWSQRRLMHRLAQTGLQNRAT